MKASILAIGTELTTGQITNRNAAWLSDKLSDLGVETVLHETVADDRERIRSALDRCQSVSQLILVTGGLGPTTDDFTRDVIADWLSEPLEFHESSWNKITDRLTRLGVPVAASNRQQAFYPRSSKVIVNDQGTADAFTYRKDPDTQIWVLPGPPREVECVWENGIAAQIRARVPQLKPLKLMTWQCIGKSEAELGEITEHALAGSGLPTGYRAHRPYVEVKVWCTDEDIRNKQNYLEALDRAIGPWVATRQGVDLAERLLKSIRAKGFPVRITDALSGGILAERLGALLREPAYAGTAENIEITTNWKTTEPPETLVKNMLAQNPSGTLSLAMAGFDGDASWSWGLAHTQLNRMQTARSPYPRIELLDRSRRFAVEAALKQWSEWLEA